MTLPCWFAGLTLLIPFPLAAQDAGEDPNEKAGKYHGVLVKRPSPGYLFDRFFDAWLDSGTVEGLESWLKTRSGADGATSADRLLLAFFHAKQGNDAGALEVFRKALAEDPGNAEAWFQKAEIEARILDFDVAIADLEKAAAAEPKPDLAIEIGKLRGRLLVRAGRDDEALKIWKGLLEAHPDDDELHEDLVELQIAEGLYDEALETSRALVEKTSDPYLKVVRQLRSGDIYQRSGKRDEALEAYAGTLDKVGQGTWIEKEVLAQIEQVFRREDDLAGLVEFFGNLIAGHSQRLPLRQRFAELLAETGQEEESIEAWEALLKLTPGDRRIREAYIRALANLDRIDEAVKQMKALVELNADDSELLIQLAGLQAISGDEKGAAESLEAYLAKSDGSEYAHLRTARLMQGYELIEQADGVFRKLLEAFPDSIGARETHAAYLFDTERKEEALKTWKQLGDSGDAMQAVRVARALASRQESEAAFDLLESRFEELKNDPVFLGQLVEVAMQNEKEMEAIPWVRRRVMLAESAIDLSEAVGQASRVIGRADQSDAILAELQQSERRTIQETCLLAELLDFNGRPGEADALLAGVGADGAELALSQQIRLERERRDWDAAAKAMERLVALPGGRKSAHVQELVNLYDRAFEADEALKWIGEWKKLSPGSISPWLKEAEILTSTGKFDESVEILRSAVQRFEDSPEIRARLGEAYYGMGKLADTERIYWRLYEDTEDPVGKGSWVQRLAKLANEMGRTETLIERFEERRRGNRTSVLPLLALSEIHRITGNYEKRRQAILEASHLQPKDVGLLHQLASIDESAGGYDSALKILESAREFDKTDSTRRRIIRIHFIQGDFEKGFAAMRESSAITAKQAAGAGMAAGTSSRREADELLIVYDAIVLRGEWERAAEFLEGYLEQFPADYRLHYLHGVALEESENDEAARESFLKILTMNQELPQQPGANQQRNQMRQSIYYGRAYGSMSMDKSEYQALFPREAVEVTNLLQYGRSAYTYRGGQSRGRIYGFARHHQGHGFSSIGSTGRSTIHPPATVDAARAQALSHLMTLLEDANDGIKANVTEAIQEQGIPELFFRFSQAQKERDEAAKAGLKEDPAELNSFGKLLVEEKDDEAYQALWLLWGTSYARYTDVAENAARLFRESRPQLAFLAAIMAGTWQEVGQDPVKKGALVDEAIAIGQEIESISPAGAQQIASVLMADFRVRNPDPRYRTATKSKTFLSDDQLVSLRKLLRNWESQLNDEDRKKNAWLDSTFLTLLSDDEDLDPWVRRLERMLDGSREQQKQTATAAWSSFSPMLSYSLSHSMSRGEIVAPISFPPSFLPEFPLEIYSMFVETTYYGNRGYQLPDKESLARHLDGISDPVLKLLIARYCEQEDRVAAMVGEMAEAEPANLGNLLIAASYATKEKQEDRASELLVQARELPESKPVGKLIDSALVSLALTAEAETPRHEAGRDAVIRMKSGFRLQQGQQQELARVMENLGLKEEAVRIRKVASRPRINPNLSRAVSVSATQNPDVLAKKIEGMIEAGNREGAVKFAARQLEQIATSLLTPNGFNGDYELQRMRQKLNAQGLSEEIMEAARPGKNAKILDRVKFGAICDSLGERETAIEIYEGVLAERPEDDSVRLRLIALLAPKSPMQALSHLEEISDSVGTRFFSNSLSNMISRAEKFDEKFNLAELAIAFLEKQPVTPGRRILWIDNVRAQLSDDLHAEDMRLPPLFEKKQSRDPSSYSGYSDAKFEKVTQRRRELYDRLCKAMLRHPQSAPSGFARQAALQLHEEGIEARAEVAALAKEVILRMEEPVFIGNRYRLSPSHRSSGGSANANEIPIRGPIELLCEFAFEAGTPASIEDDLLPELEKAPGRKAVADAIRRWSALYFCEPDEFGDAIENLRQLSFFEGRGTLYEKAIDVWTARELEFDLEPPLIKPLEMAIERNTYFEPSYLGKYATAMAKRGEGERIERILEKLSDTFLGPKEERAEFIEKHYNSRQWQSGTPNGRIHIFLGVLDSFGRSPAMAWTILERMDSNGLADTDRSFEFFRSFRSQGVWKDPEEGLALLETSPFLMPLEEYADFSTAGYSTFRNSPQKTFAGLMISQLQSLSEEELAPYLDWLKEQEQQTFGVRLLSAALPKKDRNPNVARVLGDHYEELAKLPEETRDTVAALFDGLLDDLPADSPANAVKGWAWVEEHSGNSDADQIAKFMEAEDIEDVGVREYQFDDHVGGFIANLLRDDRDKALEVFTKALEIVETSRNRNKWDYNHGSGRTFAGEMLAEVVSEADPVDGFGFQAEIGRSKELPPVELRSWYRSGLVDRIGPDDKTSPPMAEQLEGIEAAAATLDNALGNREPFCMAGPVLFDLLERYREETINALLDRLNSQEAGPLSPIRKELNMAAQLRKPMMQRKSGEPLPAMPEAPAAHFLAALKNEAVALPVRIKLAHFLADDSTPQPGGDVVLAGAGLVAEAWRGETPIYDPAANLILGNFLQSEERDGDWKRVAEELAEGFQARFVSGQAPLRLQGDPHYDTVDSMIGIYLGAGNVASAFQALSRFESRFSDFSSPMFHFVRAGEYGSAQRVLRSHREKIGKRFGRMALLDSLLEKNGPAFLESIESPSLRLFAEVVIASANDPLKPGERRVTRTDRDSPPSQRLQAVAKKFGDLEFRNPILRLEVLGLLAGDVHAARIVGEELRAEAEKINIAASIDERDSAIQKRNLGVVEGALLLAMAEGDAETVDATITRIAEAEVDDTYDKRYLADRIFVMPAVAIDSSAEPERVAASLVPFCQQMALGIEGLEPRSNRLEQRWSQLTYAMVFGGKMNEFFSWADRLGDKKKTDKHLGDWRKSTSYFNRLVAARFKGRPVEERITFMNDLLGQDWVLKRGNPFMVWGIMNSRAGGVFTYEEIVEHGAEMAEANPRQGRAWNDLAHVVNRTGKLDQAVPYWEKAIAVAEGLGRRFDECRFRTEFGKALFAKGRKDEARKVIANIGPGELKLKDFHDLRKKLGFPPAKPAVAAPAAKPAPAPAAGAKAPGKMPAPPTSLEPKDRIAVLMAAKDIRDIGIAWGSFDDYLGDFLPDLIEEDRGRAVEVFAKAVEIVATSRANKRWPRNVNVAGRTFAGDALFQLQEHTDPLAYFAFQADLARSEKVPPIELPRFWIGAGTGVASDLVWPQGRREPKRKIAETIEAVEETAGNWEPLCLAAPVFYVVADKYNTGDLLAFLDDLDQRNPAELSPITREFAVAARLRVAKDQADRMPSKVADHYIATLRNDTIPISARIALGDFLASQLTPKSDGELALAFAEVIAEGWKGDAPLMIHQILDALEMFLLEERDEAWKARAVALGEGFRSRHLARAGDPRISQSAWRELIERIMGIAVGSGDNKLAIDAFARFEDRWIEFAPALFEFIRAGEFDAGTEVLRDHPGRIGRDYIRRYSHSAVYDSGLEKNAGAFLEQLDDPSLRLLAETVIAGAPDSVMRNQDPLESLETGGPRRLRLRSVAEKFGQVEIGDPMRRRQILTLLGSDSGAAKIVGNELRAEAGEIDIDSAIDSKVFSFWSRDNFDDHWNLGVVEAVLLLEMAEGNVDEARALVDWIAAVEAKSSEDRGVFNERILRIPARAILGSSDPARTAEDLIPLCQRLAMGVDGLRTRPRFPWNQKIPASQLMFAMATAGRMDDFFPWVDQYADRQKADALMRSWPVSGTGFFQLAVERFRDRPVEERIAFVKEFLGGKWILDRPGPYLESGFQHAQSGGLLTDEELSEHGESIASESPRAGYAWDELARIFALQGKMKEAVAHWDAGIAVAESANESLLAYRFRTNKATALLDSGDRDLAQEVIKPIDPADYTDENFLKLRKRLGMK